MPTVEIDLGNGNTQRVETDDVSPEAIDSIASHLQGQQGSTTTTPTTRTYPQALGEAVMDQAKPWAQALNRVTSMTGENSLTGALGDVGTVAAPILAPAATANQIVAQAGARATVPSLGITGLPEENAQNIGRLANVATLGAQTVKGGIEGVQAWKQAKAAAPTEAGATLQREIPKGAQAVRERIQTGLFDPVGKYLNDNGRALTPGSPEAQTLVDSIQGAAAKWGDQMPRQVKTLLGKLQDVEGMNPVTYTDLDAALMPLQKLPGASTARAAINDAITGLAKGTPVEAKLNAARTTWGAVAVPIQKLATKMQRAESPEAAVKLLLQSPSGPYRAKLAEQIIGGDSAQWDRVLSGLDAMQESSKSLSGLARYFQHRALYHTMGGLAGGEYGSQHGHPWVGALVGLALGGALPYAGTAAHFLASGASGRPAAAALAKVISAWGQQHPESQGAAQDVAAALSGVQPAEQP